MSRPARRTIGWHRIIFFSPSFPPRGYFHPAVLQLVFAFLVSLAARAGSFLALSSRNENKSTLLLRPSLRSSLALSRYPDSFARRPVFLACRSLDGISFEPLATQSPFNVTKDPTFGTHITPPSSAPARETDSLRARFNHEAPFYGKSVSYGSRHPLTDDPFADLCDPF